MVGRLGLAGTVVVVLVSLFLGLNPLEILGLVDSSMPPSKTERSAPADSQFVSVVLADTEEVWGRLYPQEFGKAYQEPVLVLFEDRVQSACGMASSAVGPFYCPGDQNLYLDLDFFRELSGRLGAPGDFAQAYVIAHEVGHHIQNLSGTLSRVQQAKRRLSETEANALQVRVELQADFYAGVWAHHAQKRFDILEPGDIQEALGAASAVGDHVAAGLFLQAVVPDSFTHGSSEQRMRWFKKGFETGKVRDGDTFNATSL